MKGNNSQVFVAVVMIVIGGLFLLNTMGIVSFNIWSMLWPILLIMFGLAILFSRQLGLRWWWGGTAEREDVHIPLNGITAARIKSDGIAGQFHVTAGPAESADLISGSAWGGLNYHRKGSDDEPRIKIEQRDWFGGARWDLQFNPNVDLKLKFDGGAGVMDFDLTDLKVSEFHWTGGVGPLTVHLPARMPQANIKIDGGVGAVTLIIPQGVAAHIRAEQGLGDISVAPERFEKIGEREWKTRGLDESAHRAEVKIEGGLGSVTIR